MGSATVRDLIRAGLLKDVDDKFGGGEMSESDEAAKIALGLRADLADVIAKGVRYGSDMTIRVDEMALLSAKGRADALHEMLVALSPAATAARKAAAFANTAMAAGACPRCGERGVCRCGI